MRSPFRWLSSAAALVAVVLEIVVLRPLYRRGPLDQVLATFGLRCSSTRR